MSRTIKEKNGMADKENVQQRPQQQLKMHVDPNLDYSYRDMFNVFVGPEDVVIEFGNRHRSVENEVTINNRIVLSVSNAAKLQKALGETLTNLQKQIQERMSEQQQAAKQ